MSSTRTTKIVGFTVPPAMAQELELIAKEEQRTKSELFREMFRIYRTYRTERQKVEGQHLREAFIAEGAEEPSQGEDSPTDASQRQGASG